MSPECGLQVMQKRLKVALIAFPILAFVAGLWMLSLLGSNDFSSRQFIRHFGYYAGVRPLSTDGPFTVRFKKFESSGRVVSVEDKVIECTEDRCPLKTIEEITRRHFGDSPTQVEKTDDQIAAWREDTADALATYYVDHSVDDDGGLAVPATLERDFRGEPALRNSIWVMIFGVAGSVACAFCWIVVLLRSHRLAGD